jgi:Cdc6-like AAA superfamily ATPase
MAAKPNSTPTSNIVEKLHEQPTEPRLVILDELELVHEPDALETLATAPELAVVGIVNDPDEVGDVLSAAWGGLNREQMLRFREYSRRAVHEIVGTRAEHGLMEGSLPSRQLRTIARRADGDARLGITTLREAARQCDWNGTISSTDVDTGFDRARQQLHETAVERLTDHQEAVYEIVSESGSAAPGDIYRTYTQRVKEPRSRTAVNRYLTKMCHYGLIESAGSTRDRKYCIDQSGYVPADAA